MLPSSTTLFAARKGGYVRPAKSAFQPCHAMGHGSAQNSEDQKAQKEYVEPHAGPSAVRHPAFARIKPSSSRHSSAPWTPRRSVSPVHSLWYTSRAVNGLAKRPPESRVASRAAATRAASVTAASSRPAWAARSC